jgi:hypothetical protein
MKVHDISCPIMKKHVIEFEVTPRIYLALMGKVSQDCPLLSSIATPTNRRDENFIKPQFQFTHNLLYSLKKHTKKASREAIKSPGSLLAAFSESNLS